MFDMSFGEIVVIGAVALVVIGPERLPAVARTVGALLARAQRYVAGVKAEVQREIELDNLRKIEAKMNERGRRLGQDISGHFDVVHDMHEAGEPTILPPPSTVPFTPPPRDRR